MLIEEKVVEQLEKWRNRNPCDACVDCHDDAADELIRELEPLVRKLLIKLKEIKGTTLRLSQENVGLMLDAIDRDVDDGIPSWNIAPEWAQFRAKDADGTWWWYKYRPQVHNDKHWGVHVPSFELDGNCAAKAGKGNSWTDSLGERPRENAA